MTLTTFLLRIACAFFLGVAIGFERQWRQRMAGLRTNTLVSTGSALFVALAALTVNDASPSRIAAQIVSGIGFLGAGVIMRDGLDIRGLNTAATLWCSAAIGALTGSGYLIEAAVGTGVILAANVLLRPLARNVNRHAVLTGEEEIRYSVAIICDHSHEAQIRSQLLQASEGDGLSLIGLHSQEQMRGDAMNVKVEAKFVCAGRIDAVVESLIGRIRLTEGTVAVSWQVDL